MSEVIFSIDIETNGDIPGVSSMLSLGCAAINTMGEPTIVDKFYVNLERLPNDKQTAGNKAFWEKFPNQYEETRQDMVAPVVGMRRFRDWVRDLCNNYALFDHETKKMVPAKAVAMAYPGAWDFGAFVYWYLNYFLGEDASPFRHVALDIRTMISLVLGIPYRDAHISKIPADWLSEERKNRTELAERLGDKSFCAVHNALTDAIEQAEVYLALRKEWQRITDAASLWSRMQCLKTA